MAVDAVVCALDDLVAALDRLDQAMTERAASSPGSWSPRGAATTELLRADVAVIRRRIAKWAKALSGRIQ